MIRMCMNHANRPEVKDQLCQECLDKISATLEKSRPGRKPGRPLTGTPAANPGGKEKKRKVWKCKDPLVVPIDFFGREALLEGLKKRAFEEERDVPAQARLLLARALEETE